jgi:hypothetical protein
VNSSRNNATALAWRELERHFDHHASLMKRFRGAAPSAIATMWQKGTNEFGERLSSFEHDALVERYCELFGSWPT